MAGPTVVLGYGDAGKSAVAALLRHDHDVVVIDDRRTDALADEAHVLGVEILTDLDADRWVEILRGAEAFVPSPGVPDHHPSLEAAARVGTPVISEFDLAQRWDDRPIAAITGTDGKTTVTTMTVQILEASGLRTVGAGNTDVPLVEAIADPTYDLFVVEASSFRLGYSEAFAPQVGTWLNLGPDHLDKHRSLDAYIAAKASIWKHLPEGGLAIANAESVVVMDHLRSNRRAETFGLNTGDHRVVDEALMLGGEHLIHVDELWRALPHDQTNALSAAATARAVGATLDAIRDGLRSYRGLPHRVELIANQDGVRWYNDSKATTPHAVNAAVSGFESVVLIAGGRNKGLDLAPLRDHADRISAVIATGDAADELQAIFDGLVPTHKAQSMTEAVRLSAEIVGPGGVVLLSPACTSFDWYSSYAERGRDFTRCVEELLHLTPSTTIGTESHVC